MCHLQEAESLPTPDAVTAPDVSACLPERPEGPGETVGNAETALVEGAFISVQEGALSLSGAQAEASEPVRTELVLPTYQKNFSAAFTHAAVGFALTTLEGHLVEANQAYCALTGYPLHELRGLAADRLIHSDDQADSNRQIRRVLTGEISHYVIQNRLIRKNGDAVWVQQSVSLAQDEAGSFRWIVALIEDITARKEADEAQHAAHDTFRHLVENSPFGVYAVDADFRLVQVSAGAQKVFENVHPLLGRDFAEVLRVVWPEPFASEAIGYFRHTLATGEPYHAPGTIERRRDIGEIEAYDWKIERITLPDGLLGTVCHFYDLSERQHYEEQLRERHQFITEFTALVPGVLYVYDLEERRNVYVNRQTGLTIGYSEEEIGALGKGFLSHVLHPDDATRMQQHTAQLTDLTDGATSEVEYRFRHHDGSWRWFQSRDAVFRRDPQGHVKQILGIATDVTERKRHEQKIVDLNIRLQRSVAESHHRVKNNLQMLSALVEIQTPDSGETVPISEFKRIGQQILTLSTLHDLLTLESNVAADQDVVSLKAALEKLCPMLQTTAGRRQIRVQAQEMFALQKQGSSFVLLVNELVSNALKHGKGDVEINLTSAPVAAGAEIGGARLEVCDDGSGFHSDFTSKTAANTGLELVESIGRWDLRGEIFYENRAEGGARVVVTFPLPDQPREIGFSLQEPFGAKERYTR